MAPIHFTAIILLFMTSSSAASSIYEVLNSHGLPVGLLPNGITNYTVDPSSGRFEVHLPQSCAAQFETHLRYDSTVSGTLNYAQISDISGVAAEELFLWFAVKGIRVDIPSSGLIYFDVGVVSKQFSLSFFETPRDCTSTDNGNLLSLRRIRENHSRKMIKERVQTTAVRAVS